MMDKLKKHQWPIVAAVVILAVLAGAFWYGGGAPGLQGWNVPAPGAQEPIPAGPTAGEPDAAPSVSGAPAESPGHPGPEAAAPPQGIDKPDAAPLGVPGGDPGRTMMAPEKLALAKSMAGGQSSAGIERGDAGYSVSQGMAINPQTGKDRYLTEPVPEGKPVPVEPEAAVVTDRARTCTLSVRCDTILDNMNWLDREKWELVPKDGVIFPATAVTFYQGESVFNVLQREMKKTGIHMEFMNMTMYNSAYIEGINNLYEFDVGQLSGWLYKVNGWFPNYGCSRYQLKDGDVVQWVYTCNLGIDVGGYYTVGRE